MARRAELFVRELSGGEAAHLLKLSRRSSNPTVQHRTMLLFASFQGQSVSQIALLHRASATHVAELIHAFNAQGFACLPHDSGDQQEEREKARDKDRAPRDQAKGDSEEPRHNSHLSSSLRDSGTLPFAVRLVKCLGRVSFTGSEIASRLVESCAPLPAEWRRAREGPVTLETVI